MPFTQVEDVEIYYEVHGEGEPLLLIMGLANNLLSWHRTIPVLAKHYQVIAFDNRGVGRSGKPDIPYSIEMMANDARAVLDAVGVESTHIFGISMGGMIAQRFALSYPERVRSLILGCTTMGGSQHVKPAPEVIEVLLARGSETETPEEIAWKSVPILYSQAFIEKERELIAEDIAKRIEVPIPAYAYMRQLQATMGHNTYDELPTIQAPTLVIHGDEDALIVYDNGEIIASRIPQAQMVRLPGAGHIFWTEAPEATNQAILTFLQGASSVSS